MQSIADQKLNTGLTVLLNYNNLSRPDVIVLLKDVGFMFIWHCVTFKWIVFVQISLIFAYNEISSNMPDDVIALNNERPFNTLL